MKTRNGSRHIGYAYWGPSPKYHPIIVNGRYDVIYPLITACKLHKLLPKSKLIISEGAGHWMRERLVERALLKAMQELG